ncbi:MAG: hypothetical protein L3J20_10480 [Flavobacteriaceae bacterium]|nr:hypothetical protein [Flavobacteriaceae bacterium]
MAKLYILQTELNNNQQPPLSEKKLTKLIAEYDNLFREVFDIPRTEINEPTLIDNSNTKGTEKIIYLKELGILDYLLTKEPFNLSTNALANVLSSITGEKPQTLQSYLNPITSPTAGQDNNPLNNIKNVEKVKQSLINVGFKTK